MIDLRAASRFLSSLPCVAAAFCALAPTAVAGDVAWPAAQVAPASAGSSSAISSSEASSGASSERAEGVWARPTGDELERLVSSAGATVPVAAAIRCGGPCAPSCAPVCEDDPCVPACPRWSVTLGAWIWGSEGSLGASGRTVDVDSDWTDTLEMIDKLEFALNARVRGEFGRWSVTVEVDGATIADTASFREGGLAIDAEVSSWMLQAHAGYHLTGGRLGDGACAPVGCLGVYAGLRANWISLDLDPSPGGPAVDRSLEWVDPIVGLRGELRFDNGWFGLAELDIGGFGVGSDLAWHLLAAVGYRFSESFAVEAGWKILDVDYEDGGQVWDVQMSGPFLAFTFTF